MYSPDFFIPVTRSVEDFVQHLKSHPRTILSAKFGDGKSFFLTQLTNDVEADKTFKFLTVYPVNYQVENNKDIFELVKRDIFLQMLTNDMISDDYEVSDCVAFAFALQKILSKVDDDLLSIVGDVFSYFELKTPALISKLISLSSKISAKLKNIDTSNDTQIKNFFKKADKNISIENDAITQIIRENIKLWKENNKDKRVVILFEDMDRLDPAHMFRILNVLSAHLDYGYKFGYQSDNDLVGNKFGVDNIVVVLDYENLERIFHHMYGLDTNFVGYIHKFTSSNPFFYSFATDRNIYIRDYYAKITGLDANLITKLLLDTELDKIDLRLISNSIIDLEEQIYPRAIGYIRDTKYIYSGKMLKMYIIMRRLGFTNSNIREKVSSAIEEEPKLLQHFVWYALSSNKRLPYYFVLKRANRRNTPLSVQFSNILEDGDANVSILTSLNADNIAVTASEIASSLFKLIAQ